MWRLIKVLFYAAVLASVGLIGYAYIGPILGVDFVPPQETVTIPVELDFE